MSNTEKEQCEFINISAIYQLYTHVFDICSSDLLIYSHLYIYNIFCWITTHITVGIYSTYCYIVTETSLCAPLAVSLEYLSWKWK